MTFHLARITVKFLPLPDSSERPRPTASLGPISVNVRRFMTPRELTVR